MILTDDVLAGMSGSERAQQVLAIRPRLPVLVMGGNLPEASGRSAWKIGVRARLHKPLALQELTERLAALFVA